MGKESLDDVHLIKKLNDSNFEENTIDYFLHGFVFPKGSYWSTFYVDTHYYEGVPQRYLGFAANGDYNLFYVYDKITTKIFTWDYEDDSLDWPCGVSVSAFFESMTLVLERDLKCRVENNWELDPEYNK
ncbi:MAG TPA: hypothetical protein VHS96_09170, partial [Bacteroidia bacterium]|nr:hypothetical protein [Bacteroidia bacterium]